MVLYSCPGANSKIISSRSGFSFAELVFSIAIVAVVLVTLIGTLISGLEALQKGTGYNQANIIAQRTVEYYKSLPYDSITAPFEETKSEEGFVVYTKITTGSYSGEGYKKLYVKVSKAGDLGSITESKRATKRVEVVMETFFVKL